jgi:hypothetical protein
MADTAGLIVCPHVLDGFKEGNIVCQVDTDKGKLNVATCRSCILEVLEGNREAWGKYKTVTNQEAAVLGVVTAEDSGQAAAPVGVSEGGSEAIN